MSLHEKSYAHAVRRKPSVLTELLLQGPGWFQSLYLFATPTSNALLDVHETSSTRRKDHPQTPLRLVHCTTRDSASSKLYLAKTLCTAAAAC